MAHGYSVYVKVATISYMHVKKYSYKEVFVATDSYYRLLVIESNVFFFS